MPEIHLLLTELIKIPFPHAFWHRIKGYCRNGDILRNVSIMAQKVLHDPIFRDPEPVGSPNNRAHSIIVRDSNDANFAELRLKMVSMGSWSIGPE